MRWANASERLADEVPRPDTRRDFSQADDTGHEHDRDTLHACILEEHAVGHFGSCEMMHLDVQDDQVGELLMQHAQTFAAVACQADLVSVSFEHVGEQLVDVGVDDDDEQSRPVWSTVIATGPAWGGQVVL